MAEAEKLESQTHQQHPIPQNVLGVEFKLVGGLTLRQFGFLAFFLVIAFLIYSSGLPALIKTPLAASLAILGIFISLVPIQDRSADVWIKNFLIAVSSPTERVWRKGPANLDVFFELREAHTVISQTPELGTAKDRSQIRQYLRRVGEEEQSPQDIAEREFLRSVALLQGEVAVPQGIAPAPAPTLAERIAKEGEILPGTTKPFRARQELRLTENLASEINFSQEKIITLPTATLGGGTRPRFVTPIQNVRAGRPLRLVKPGEVGLPIAGEKIVTLPPSAEKQAEILVERLQDVTGKIDRLKLEKEKPLRPGIETKEEEKRPELTEEKVTLPIPPAPMPAPTAAPPEGLARGRIASLAEEVEGLKAEKEKLLLEIEKQKKAREEAETIAQLSKEYQTRVSELTAQNSRLTVEMKKNQDELRRLENLSSSTTSEREMLIKQIKESEKRMAELAREKTQATDSLINLQKELRELRLKQKFPLPAPPPPSEKAAPAPTAAKPKLSPIVKDETNVINGYVKGKAGNLIKNAVVIIKDQEGSPVRALKTNELGQFAITTPVPNGVYTVEVSSQGEAFDIITVEVFGSVLEPVELTGK